MTSTSRPFASSKRIPAVDHTNIRAQPTKSGQVDLSILQNASAVLVQQLNKDAQIIPDLGDTLTAPGGQASGLYSVYPDDFRVPFQKRKLVGIPEGLFQFYNNTSVTSHMGLLPEIERVWISIDHKLFLWDYMEGQEISSFVDQPDVITHVATVKPKPGLFIDEISHILVICTPVSILLIALSFESSHGPGHRPHKDIKLYATDLTLQCEVEMTSVVGTDNGRIFMCGAQDGSLYELHYQEKESWFGKRIQLINHSISGVQSLLPRFASSAPDDRIISVVADNVRGCLYTLTSKSTISIYKLNEEKSIQHVQTISNLYKAAQDKAPGSPALTPQNFQIIALHIIDVSESRSGVQLMAITTNGVRLYFSPIIGYQYPYGSSSSSATGLRSLQLIHVRIPPTNLLHPDVLSTVYRPSGTYGATQPPPPSSPPPYLVSGLESSCYCHGSTLAAQQGDTDGTDFLLCMSPDLTRIGALGQTNIQNINMQQPPYVAYGGAPSSNRVPLTEYATLLAIPGRTWAMAPVPHSTTISSLSAGPIPVITNELATQFSEPPRQFMVLTNVGLTFLAKRRAIDYLRAVIEEVQSDGNIQPIIEFRDSFGRDQTCAMLLALACGNTFLDFAEGSPIGTISMVSPDIANVAKQAFYDFGERPTWTERPTYGTTEAQGITTFSGRREGFALYFARLAQPLWKAKLTKMGSSNMQQLSVPDTVLITIQKNLFALKEFLDTNPHLFHSSPADPVNSRSGGEQEAWMAEQYSVAQLLNLLTRTTEALSFILLLNDYRLGELIALCEPDVQRLVSSMTLEELVTTQNGMTVSRALVNIIIDQQIGQQISVDTISEVLQQRCGSFCSSEDVMLYKAKENIKKAVETRSTTERQNWLAESLRLFFKGARNLEFEKLREICGDYQQLNFAKGAVELPLLCARLEDPDNLGYEFWYSGSSGSNGRKEAYERRVRCYELILDSLMVFEEKCAESQAATTNSTLATDDPETVRSHAFQLAFLGEDEVFHATLYDWLIGRGLADELLEMRPVYLEAHLKREPVTVQKYELLWQFYVKDGQPLRAAEVLATFAESTQFAIDLDRRLEYLTLAVGNAKSHPISAGGRHETAITFLTDLEEKLEVAQVQLEIYNTLLPHVGDAVEVSERVQLLSKRLFTMSELYQNYAIPFDLPVIKLLCFYVSNHRDESMVRPVWNQIFEEVIDECPDPNETADRLTSKIVMLGQRFFPSESAFPVKHIATLLVRFSLNHKDNLPPGWPARILIQCGVPHQDVWDILHEMYESQIPPFNDQANVQAISSEIAVLLSDWLEEAKRPQSSLVGRGEFPVGRIDLAVDQYLAELEPTREQTKTTYESIKRQLRRNW